MLGGGGVGDRSEPQRQELLRLAQPGGVARSGGEEQADEDLLDEGADRFEGQRGLAVYPFPLQKGVGHSADDHVVLHPG